MAPKRESVRIDGRSLLAKEFSKRVETLGISRRELAKRIGISRQTFHNIEIDNRVELRAGTLAAIDAGLYWKPGTAQALAQGDASVLPQYGDAESIKRAEQLARSAITESITSMTLDQLDALIALIDHNTSNDVSV